MAKTENARLGADVLWVSSEERREYPKGRAHRIVLARLLA